MRNIVITSALTALSLAVIATPAAAEATRYVSYADLDLTNSAGRAALRQRVSDAVEQVCGKADVRNIHSANQVAECRTDTWAATQPQLNEVLGGSVRVLANATIAIGQAVSARRSQD
ncbi:MAG TPA: UrcA family protein [Croceibacterium sp.]|nr:UrcA family protein [Croceibacterium sp.]